MSVTYDLTRFRPGGGGKRGSGAKGGQVPFLEGSMALQRVP